MAVIQPQSSGKTAPIP